MKKILLADDHPLIRDAVKETLKKCYPDCHIISVSDWMEVASTLDCAFDLFIFDYDMPGRNKAFKILKHINEDKPNAGIFILTMHTESWVLRDLLLFRINAFISKISEPSEIINAIEAFERAETYFCGEFRRIIKERTKWNETLGLTKRELEVLTLILEAKSFPKIAEELSISANTVETHRKNLYLKYEVNSALELVVKIWGARNSLA